MTPLQLLSKLSQTSVAPGFIAALLSLQSPSHVVTPSLSTSNPSSTLPSQLSSKPLQTSAESGFAAAFSSLQSNENSFKVNGLLYILTSSITPLKYCNTAKLLYLIAPIMMGGSGLAKTHEAVVLP